MIVFRIHTVISQLAEILISEHFSYCNVKEFLNKLDLVIMPMNAIIEAIYIDTELDTHSKIQTSKFDITIKSALTSVRILHLNELYT